MTATFLSPDKIRITGYCQVDGGWTEVFYEADFQERGPTDAADEQSGVEFFRYSISRVPALQYVDASDSPQTQEDYAVYTGERVLAGGWYAVMESRMVSGTINVTGDVNLVLCDGASLTVNGGIVLPSNMIGAGLTIWWQSGHSGELSAAGTQGRAGIEVPGAAGLTINGGKINARGDEDAAGIGGGSGTRPGSITINNSAVVATGGDNGAGIGGDGGTVTISGRGTVHAISRYSGAGIGGGRRGDGGTVTITSGGLVIAEAGFQEHGTLFSAQAIGHGLVIAVRSSGDLELYDDSEVVYGVVENPVHDLTIRGRTAGKDRVDRCHSNTYALIRPKGVYRRIYVKKEWEPDGAMADIPDSIEVVLQHYEDDEDDEEGGKQWVTKETERLSGSNNWGADFNKLIPEEDTDSWRIRELTEGADRDRPIVYDRDDADIAEGAEANSVTYTVNDRQVGFKVLYQLEFESGIMYITNQEVSDITVKFVLNGGTMDGQTGTVERGVVNHKVEEPHPAPTREGYAFGGWYSDRELTQEFDFDTEILVEQTLYARWTKEWTVEKVWVIGDWEDTPESIQVDLLKRDQNGLPSFVESLMLDEAGDWEGSFTISTGAAEINSDRYLIRERDVDNTVIFDKNDGDAFEEVPTAYYTVYGARTGYQVKNEMNEETGHMKITNSTMKEYSFEISWDIDLGDTDRPNEIEVALQKKTGKIQYETLQVVTVSQADNWSGTFEPVPIGEVNDDGVFEPYTYRIREITPLGQDEQRPEDQDEYYRSCDKRTVHDTFDFDKPFIKNMFSIADPNNLWSADFTMSWLISQAKKVLIPPPAFVTRIPEHVDQFGMTIEEGDTKYHAAYSHNSSTHRMSIKNTAVIDASVYKHWRNFEDDEMPEAVYIMLMSKVQDDYAAQLDMEDVNIYTPVFTVVYGPQLTATNIPGLQLDDKIKDGLKSLLGDIGGTVVNTVVQGIILDTLTKTGIACVEVNESGGYNPIAQWHTRFGVKKYGGFGVPMDFAGAELVTGMMEMVVDALIKQMHIPKISMPIMYDPINDCWSIKGYCLQYPGIDKDYEVTGNVINFKVHWDGTDGNIIRGVKHWVDNDASDRPESVKIHLYAKEKDSDEKTELSISPITVQKPGDGGDDWPWSVEIPLSEIVVQKEDRENPENSEVTYKEVVIEEEVPDGYEEIYDGYDITNKKDGIETISISGKKTWDDDDNAEKIRPSSIIIRLLGDSREKASRKVTEADGWKWEYKNLPKYQNDGSTEISYEIRENSIPDYKAVYGSDYSVTNEWVGPKPVLRIRVDGNSDSKVYSGSEQSFAGTFTASCSEPGFDAGKFRYSGNTTASGKDVGSYETDPEKGSCSYDDDQYRVIWEMGDPVRLKITPARITVRVSGHTDTKTYTGSEQSVTGYDLSCDSGLYNASDVGFSGEDTARGTDVGTYAMGLSAAGFSYGDPNVTASFLVSDGWLRINPVPDPDKLTITGGPGTLLFYLFGIILVMGAGSMLAVSKRQFP